jgi:hypothetical protein
MPVLRAHRVFKIALLIGAAWLLYGAAMEFYNIAWGTGDWYGEFSFKWAVAHGAFVAGGSALLILWGVRLLRGTGTRAARRSEKIPPAWRWLFATVVLAAPIVVLQYSPWGVVIDGLYLRLLIWVMCIAALSTITWPSPEGRWSPEGLFLSILVSGSAFVVAAALTEVTAYPFSLGWSEGNRLWDYSLLFGKRLYSFQPGQEPFAYLDFGRQLLGGLPFLLPRVSILGARLWLAAMASVPYALLGLMAFRPERGARPGAWIAAGLLGFMFLAQGPIHAPLLICALLVALACRLPLWWAAPLVAVAGYFAEASRFTWMFAPAMWAVMLEIGAADSRPGPFEKRIWRRAIVLACAGLLGSAMSYAGLFPLGETSVGSSAAVSTSQVLLWYRLLPNATYGDGILLGLLKATGPLTAVLIYSAVRYWRPKTPQVLVIGLSLLAFLVVGMVISTKIGGGGDLHNLDMFLIGLLFTAGILWRSSQGRWTGDLPGFPAWVMTAIVLMLTVPAIGPLMSLRPMSFHADAEWLSVLADVERPRDLGSLPDDATVQSSLQQIRETVEEAERQGQVLFLDQRQLLTFGYVKNVELISAYEKKRMMDEALSGNEHYFAAFYRDLAAKRFALLVSGLLRTPIKDNDYGFGEENNAWVTWVAKPVLCYYEEKDTLDAVKVELLVPRMGTVDCSAVLPQATE